jgi:hypothetical protein
MNIGGAFSQKKKGVSIPTWLAVSTIFRGIKKRVRFWRTH